MQPRFSLEGKSALVTGAGRGIGRAIALGLADAGAAVTLCARSAVDLESVAAEIRTAGARAEVLVADVTEISSFAADIGRRPGFDIFINNAGTNRPKPLSEVTLEDYEAVMALNLKAAIFATKAVTARMKADGKAGSVVNMSSQMGHVGAANRTLYCASKWAIEGFTKALAVELGSSGIRVNTISPTFIDTPLTRPMFEHEEFRISVLKKIKLGRIGQVEDVVGAAIFLASDASGLMTGSALMLDGGWTAD